jgi:hypothetical protein
MINDDIKGALLMYPLTIEEFFILYLLYEDREYLKDYLQKNKFKINFKHVLITFKINNLVDYESSFIDDLDKIKMIKNIDDIFKIDFNSFFNHHVVKTSDFESLWTEFIDLYPKKTGLRPLHNNKEKCKDKYKFILRNTKHSDIIKGLNTEIELRNKAKIKKEFFPEWKLLTTYISQKGWEQFLEINEEDIIAFDDNGRITKKL